MFKPAIVRVAVGCALALLFLQQTCAAPCTSGVLRMKPFPAPIGDFSDDCFASTTVSENGVKSLCSVAYKAAVNASGVVRLTPLSTATVSYSQVASSTKDRLMPCKNLNASGLLKAGSSTSATVTMFDELGGPISNLTKTGPHQITLYIARSYGYNGPGPVCRYNYTVVSGCFFGIKAPTPPPACPIHQYIATGLGGAKFCAPCPPGTTSATPNSKSCTACPAGTFNPNYSSKCRKCPLAAFSPKVGATQCQRCSSSSNQWWEGKRCAKCPPGSYGSPTNPTQCDKCKAGVKCCTVNPSSDCPACPKGWTPGPPVTSVFALSSGTRDCLASNYARCAPKFSATMGQTCLLTIKPMPPAGEDADCGWEAVIGIKGGRPDTSYALDYIGSEYTALAGDVTAAAPYLDFTLPLPPTECTLRYRALTAPAAKLLGASPKPCPKGQPGCPSFAGTCPAGQYLETQTDTKLPPCLPCPPGTFSPAPSAARCTPCPLGHFAAGYGSKACERCPAATPLTPKPGAASCQPCPGLSLGVGVNKCKDCPSNSGWFPFGRVDNIRYDACLSNQFGSICCKLGSCSGQPTCPSKLQNFQSPAGAVLQLVSRSLPQPQCKSATLLTCMDSKAMALLSSPYVLDIQLDPVLQPRCTPNGGASIFPQIPSNLWGSYASPKRAIGSYYTFSGSSFSFATGYQLLSNAAKGTVTITMLASNPKDPNIINTTGVTPCTATFKLVAGYAFDLTPPAGAKCPPNAVPARLNGRLLCNFCPAGQYKKAPTGKCTPCPAGRYQDQIGATSCKACPAGAYCPTPGSPAFIKCSKGSLRPKAGSVKACVPCPADTYGTEAKGVTSCTACPKFTVAAEGSVACSVPFPK